MRLIRHGTQSDLPALSSIADRAARLFPEVDLQPRKAQPLLPAELLASLDAGLVWVAEDGHHGPVGFIACERLGEFLHICETDVLPEHGRRGIGTALLRHVIAQAAAQAGVQSLTLTTFKHLPWNAPFYARNGFEPLVGGGGIGHLERALSAEAARGLKNRVAMARAVV